MLRPSLPASCLAVIALLLLAACATAPGVRQLPDEAVQAEQLYREGQFRAAAEAFLFAAEGSRSNRDFFRLRAAEALREEGDLDAAARTLAGINPRSLDDGEQQRLQLLQAELALADGDAVLALRHLDLVPARLPAAQQARLYELRGRAYETTGENFAAAAEYARLEPLLRDHERADNSARIARLLGGLDDLALLAGSDSLPRGDLLQPYAARILNSRGLAVPAHFRQQWAEGTGVDFTRAPRIVALLLPQSGQMQLASASVRDGFMTAHYGMPDTITGERPEVRVYDSGETPEQALQAYRLAAIEGAEAVVGPLSREAVSALFAEPDLPVPVIGMNRSIGPVPPGSISFALAPEEEAAAVAVRMQQRGLRSVLAVVGSDDTAQRSLAGFTARHLRAGGQLVGTVVVPDNSVDYLAAIRSTLLQAGLPTSAPQELATEHDSGFDAVFLALRLNQARLAVPQLRIFGVVEVPILATSSINAIDEEGRLDRDLNGIEFSEVPWLLDDLPGLPSRRELADRFDSARGPAARLFAFGLDAYRLLVERQQLQQGGQYFDGATGRIEVDGFGEARRQPGIAVFRNQRAQLLHAGALISDGEPAR